MIKSNTILILAMLTASMCHAQNDLSVIGNVVQSYLNTVSNNSLDERNAGLDTLMTTEANMTSVLIQESGSSSHTMGSWQEYLANSESFYNEYSLEFDELEREVDYYLDMASVHVLTLQLSTKKATRRKFKQTLWIQLDLVYLNDRWYISDALWINEGKVSIDEALMQDTLIRVPD